MHVKRQQAEKLYELGFYKSVPKPVIGTVFYHDGLEWTVGGAVGGETFIPNIVLKEGLWLPDENALLDFLHRRNFSVTYSYNGLWLSAGVYPENGRPIKLRAVTLCDALCEAVLRILQDDYK